MKFFIQAIVFLILFAAAPCVASSFERRQEPEAQLSLKDLDGSPQSLNDHAGKIVVLNFWATWCVPCREEMPLLVSLQKRYAARGVQVIGASADEPATQKEIPQFVRKLKINFPIWVGASVTDMQRFGLGDELPATVFIDRDKKIVGRVIGVLKEKEMLARIEWLLGDRTGPAPPAVVNNIEKHDHDHDEKEHKHNEKGHDHNEKGHHHEGEEEHEHGGVGVEGASTVPS